MFFQYLCIIILCIYREVWKYFFLPRVIISQFIKTISDEFNYKNLFMDLNKNKLCSDLIQKLTNSYAEVLTLWDQKKKVGAAKFSLFLIGLMGNENYSSLCADHIFKSPLKTFLENIENKPTQTKYQEYVKTLKQALIERKLLLEENNQNGKQPIKGQNIIVTILYNIKNMQMQYAYQQIKLRNQLQKFVKVELQKVNFNIISQTKSLIVLKNIQQVKDDYTEIYIFDPFFNSIKINISKTDNTPFKGQFFIKSRQITKFQYIPDQDPAKWKKQSDFNLNDPVKNLVHYIIQKENGSLSDQKEILDKFQHQRIEFIKDLSINILQTLKYLERQKWSNQIEAQLKKINSLEKSKKPKNENTFDKQKLKKIQCFRRGVSHKILRYLFYMTHNQNYEGLTILNKKIPMLNPQLVKDAISIVKNQLQIKNLFEEIQKDFRAFYITDTQKIQKDTKKLGTPNGILFYGPPGTGKTRLTQDLAELMGMHPVSIGLSSSQFMRELVGQAKGAVSSYLRRPIVSPHLICFFSIDEFDAIVGDRRKQHSKSGEATTMFLSGLGGNTNIPNLLVFGSTNYKKDIDEAIIRRFTPNYYVGFPTFEDRIRITHDYLPTLDQAQLLFLAQLTPNFSGAAIKLICHKLGLQIHKKQQEKIQEKKQEKKQDKKQQIFSTTELLSIIKSVAIQLKIKFGGETYPHLYQKVNKQISMKFMREVYNNMVIIELDRDVKNKCKLVYAKRQYQWNNKTKTTYINLKETQINLNTTQIISSKLIDQWIRLSIKREPQNVTVQSVNSQKKNINAYFRSYQVPTLLIIDVSSNSQIFSSKQIFKPQSNNLYVIFYVETMNGQQIFKDKSGYKFQYSNKQPSGRFIVDLTKQNSPINYFQLKPSIYNPLKLQQQPFLQVKGISNSKDALPEVVEFLISKKVDYIQIIDNQLLTDNNAFEQKQYHKIITEKIDQARNYRESGLIIDLNSLISVSRNISYTQHGENVSTSINEKPLYKQLLQLMNKFGQIKDNSKRWIAIIVEDIQLLKTLKKDLKWPNSSRDEEQRQQRQQKEKQEAQKKKIRTCKICSKFYTYEENKKQKTCKVHYGYLMDDQSYKLLPNLTLRIARQLQYRRNFGKDEKQKTKYLFSCCLGFLDSDPCQQFQHWGGNPNQPESYSSLTKRKEEKLQMEKLSIELQTQKHEYIKK